MNMNYFHLLVTTTLALTACSYTDSNTLKKESVATQKTSLKQSNQDSLVSRTTIVPALSDDLIKQLNKLLNEDAVKLIQYHHKQWENVQTENDFAKTYHEGEKLFESLNTLISKKFGDDAYEAMSNLEILEKSFLFRASCEAECSVFMLKYFHPGLQKLADATTGNADDDFIESKILAEGEIGAHQPTWINFFIRTWDYGGGSLLGDYSNTKYLKLSFHALKKSALFQKDILLVR